MNEIRQKKTEKECKKRGVSRERSKAGKKKESPDGPSLPNQNTIRINIILYYFIRNAKHTVKFN